MIKKFEVENKYIIVTLEANISEEKTKLILSKDCKCNVKQIDGEYTCNSQAWNSQAWKADCVSGILYALRRAKIDNFKITILNIEGVVSEWDGDGFACAAMLATYNELKMDWEITNNDLMGWIISDFPEFSQIVHS